MPHFRMRQGRGPQESKAIGGITPSEANSHPQEQEVSSRRFEGGRVEWFLGMFGLHQSIADLRLSSEF